MRDGAGVELSFFVFLGDSAVASFPVTRDSSMLLSCLRVRGDTFDSSVKGLYLPSSIELFISAAGSLPFLLSEGEKTESSVSCSMISCDGY